MKIGIIGLGLIGGSILKALSAQGFETVAVTRNNSAIENAKNFTKFVSSDKNSLAVCDVVFVCTPVSKTLETLDELEKIVRPECVVTDVASVKRFVCAQSRPFLFVPSHPMAGTEKSGFDASFSELFVNRKWIFCADENLPEVKTLVEIVEKIGAIPVFTTSEEHDRAVSLISHLPVFIAQTLRKTAQNDDFALSIASSGFKDTTRVADTNPVLARDMLDFNKDNILSALQIFKKHLAEFEKSLS